MERDEIVKSKIELVEQRCEQVRLALAECPDASPAEAKKHSAYALETSLMIVRVLRDVNTELIKIQVQKDAAYSNAFKLVDDKINVSKAKAIASGDKNNQIQTVKLKQFEGYQEYFKKMYEVCENSHRFYKSQAFD